MELTNLKDYVEGAKVYYYDHYGCLDWHWDEGMIWAIQEYLSMRGEFSEEDAAYLATLGYEPEDFIDED